LAYEYSDAAPQEADLRATLRMILKNAIEALGGARASSLHGMKRSIASLSTTPVVWMKGLWNGSYPCSTSYPRPAVSSQSFNVLSAF